MKEYLLKEKLSPRMFSLLIIFILLILYFANIAIAMNISQVPLLVRQSVTPQVMLTMSNDHQLYFEAYPDYADLTGDGAAERTYNHDINYYGYFDSYKCYNYDNSKGLFVPESKTSDKYCNDNWSGNFLNYISMARIDIIRKILYGGYRSLDAPDETVLERTYLPNDAHSWVRYYDGDDINKLTPFSLPSATETTSSTSLSVPAGSRNDSGDRKTFSTGWNSAEDAQVGDQVIIRSQGSPDTVWMEGVIISFSTGSGEISVQVTNSSGIDNNSYNDWKIINESRQGISFCNTTVSSTTWSQNVTDPPLIRVASGNYSLWTANERWQCRWSDEKDRTGHNEMRVGGINFSNGNAYSFTGIPANSDNPDKSDVGLGINDYNARVEVCVDGLIGAERCKQYPDGNYKPIGLLQHYGDDGRLHFGLLTGSYSRNKSGGVLRKNTSKLEDEVNISTDGTFKEAAQGSIIGSLNLMRIYGYSHNDGTYESSSGDHCPFGLKTFTDGRCTNWGNPMSEMFLETLRYFSSTNEPYPDFKVSGDDKIPDLTSADWDDPLCTETWCAPLSIIAINASIPSYDHDQFGGLSDIGASSISQLTDVVGQGEGIHNQSWFVGEFGTGTNDRLCTPKSIANLGQTQGLCPEAPSQQGTFHIAGLSHYAYTQSLRSDLVDSQGNTVDIQAKTYAVEMAPAVPTINIPLPNQTETAVQILPACENIDDNGRCGLVDFKIVDQDIAAGTGKFLINWEAAEWGGDYDMDMNGILSYQISSAEITVTTEVFAQSSTRELAFGYIISGTTQDGYHAHSGINGYSYTDPTGVLSCNNCNMGDPATAVTYDLGSSTGDLLQTPLYYAAKWGGYNKKKSFPSDQSSWDSQGDGLPDNYYFAIDPAKLAQDLEDVFIDVVETTGSAASVVANSSRIDSDTYIYQARFKTDDWSGELIAYPIRMDGSIDEPEWEAGSLISYPGRKIYTYNPEAQDQGIEFLWSELNEDQKIAIGSSDVLDYIRGNQSYEEQNNGTFRNRNSLLGDIVNSNPAFVRTANFGYNIESIPEGFTEDEHIEGAYNQFLSSVRDRTPMIYVGANDGMLHAFRASDGHEMFAFIPNEVIPNLLELTDPGYSHLYFVDGPPRVGDAYIEVNPSIGKQWRTVLVGSTGAGGKSVFALDITDPDDFSEQNVLWEFAHEDLGYTIGQPTIARLKTNHWVAIFGNGYNSKDGSAKLFILDLESGEKLKKIETSAGDLNNPNGLSSPIPVDKDNDRITDYVYAGDLHGNMWRFDFTGNNINNWKVDFNGDPLYTALNQDGQPQPITARPSVGRHPDGGVMVYFGTGKFFETGDNILNIDQHSTFYALRDTGSSITSVDRNDEKGNLQEQAIIAELFESDLGVSLRMSTNEDVNYTDDSDENENPIRHGWYMDLISPVYGKQGEMVVHSAIIQKGRLIFVTMIPSDIPCDFGGSSWLMELDALTGARLDYPPFDLNSDRMFTVEDMLTVTINNIEMTIPPSAIKPNGGGGILTPPTIIDTPIFEIKYLSSSSGDVETIVNNPGDAASAGRQSWRQLR
ncbi:pilus assembly protein [Desulfonatronovibrio magnus]|uniref:pilus assembly protein n=1 Tax=Desulfonatronovibrio magnus TaxID=698827 RepID=UPI000ACBB92E|nr:PilC/PilY family type IV pilus protein [Desulfonatronovibrio magnus]